MLVTIWVYWFLIQTMPQNIYPDTIRGCLFDFLVYVQTRGRVVGGQRRKREKGKTYGDTEHERMHCKYACLLEDAHTRMQHNSVLKTTYRRGAITQVPRVVGTKHSLTCINY